MEVNPGVTMLSDPDYPVDQIPTPASMLAQEYHVFPDGSDHTRYVRLIPAIENGTLALSSSFVNNGAEYAGSPLMITPDDPGVLNTLNKLFKASIDQDSQYFEDGEIHLPFNPGRYAVHLQKDQITFYRLNQNDEIITDSGMSYPAFYQ